MLHHNKAAKSSSNRRAFNGGTVACDAFVEDQKLASGMTDATFGIASDYLLRMKHEGAEPNVTKWHEDYWSDMGRIEAMPAELTADAIVNRLVDGPVKGQWYRGATPPGYPSSMSAFELEMRYHHKGVTEGKRLSLPRWIVANEVYVREKAQRDAAWTWLGEPKIDPHCWQDAQALLDTPKYMDCLQMKEHGPQLALCSHTLMLLPSALLCSSPPHWCLHPLCIAVILCSTLLCSSPLHYCTLNCPPLMFPLDVPLSMPPP